MQILNLIVLLSSLLIAISATKVGLRNIGVSCYINTALQAIASVPAIPNVILSVDPQGLKEEKYRSVLLKLQTILYALRTGNANISSPYLRGFVQAFSTASGRNWNHGQQDASEFYLYLIDLLDTHLLPEAKSKELRALLQLTKIETNIPSRATDGRLVHEAVITLPCQLNTVTSLKHGLDAYFGAEAMVVKDGTFNRQYLIESPPPVLNLYMNRTHIPGTPKASHKITFPNKLNINAYKHADAKWKISPEYELRYIAVHHGPTLNGGHYYGFWFDADRGLWIKLDDSTVQIAPEDVFEFTSQGNDTAHMLYYVNVDSKKDLFKVETVPPAILAQINTELASQGTSGGAGLSPHTPHSTSGSGGSSSGGSSGGYSSGGGSSGSSSSGSGSGSSSSSSSPDSGSVPTPEAPPAQEPATTTPNDTQPTSEQKKFSWFGLKNGTSTLKPTSIPLPLLIAAVILAFN